MNLVDPVRLIVFDMAGTTVDEGNVVYKTVREAVNSQGYDFSLEQVLEHGAGKEKAQAIRDVLCLDGEIHEDREVEQIFADFKSRLKEAYSSLDVREQAGASAAFAQLRAAGIQVVLNTGYNRVTAESLIEKLGWTVGSQIDGLVTASDVDNGRPAPDMILKAMSITNVSTSASVVKVGDSQIDIEEGKNANCGKTFGITTGAQTESQLWDAGPDGVVHSLDEFVQAVSPPA